MTEHQRDPKLEHRIVAALDRRVQQQEPGLTQRLDRARRTALAEAESTRRSWFGWPALAATGTAALVALLVLVQPDRPGDPGIPALPMSEDLDLLTAEEFELFAEDPEFYAWIVERPVQQRERRQERRGGTEGSAS